MQTSGRILRTPARGPGKTLERLRNRLAEGWRPGKEDPRGPEE